MYKIYYIIIISFILYFYSCQNIYSYNDIYYSQLSNEQAKRLEEYNKIKKQQNKKDNKNNNKLRKDLKNAIDNFDISVDNILSALNNRPQQTALFLADIKKWNNIDINKDIGYLLNTHPFYDNTRIETIAIWAKTIRNQELLSKILGNSENDILKQEELLNQIAWELETTPSTGVKDNILFSCLPNNDENILDTIGDVVGEAEFKGNFIISQLINLGSFIYDNTHLFNCHSRKGINKYSVIMFYSNGNKKFSESEKGNIKDKFGKFSFSTTTPISNLDYVLIKANGSIDNKNREQIIVYRINKDNKKVTQIDTNNFINNIMPYYK